MSGRQYSDEEIALVRELYPTTCAADIAAQLNCSRRAVYWLAGHLGLAKQPRIPCEVFERVRALHAEGLTDAEIARRVGLDRRQARWIRSERLRLPRNEAAILAAGRRAVESQRRTLGIRSGGDLRRLGYRRFAVANGWPEDLRPRAVQILNLLAAKGVPLSRPEIAAGIGMPWKGTRKSLVSNDPEGSYLAHLAHRGLVLCLPRALVVTGEGKGRSRHLYTLGQEALAILEERSRCAKKKTDTTPSA